MLLSNRPLGTLQHGFFRLGSKDEQIDLGTSTLGFLSHHDTIDLRRLRCVETMEHMAYEEDREANGP